jgi:hypothetical protein
MTEREPEPAEASVDGPGRGPAGPQLVSRWWPPLTALACAAVLALAAYAGAPALAAAVLLLSALLIWGWPLLLDLPAPRGTLAALGLAALMCDGAVVLTTDEPLLDWLALAVAGGVLTAFVHQLIRTDGRPRLVESLSGEVMGVALLACAAALIALPRTKGGADAVLALCVAAAATAVVELLPFPERLLAFPSAVAAAAAGGVAAGFARHTPTDFGVVLGLAFAVAAIVLRRMFMARPVQAFLPAAVSMAVAPIAASGIVTYVLARLFIG